MTIIRLTDAGDYQRPGFLHALAGTLEGIAVPAAVRGEVEFMIRGFTRMTDEEFEAGPAPEAILPTRVAYRVGPVQAIEPADKPVIYPPLRSCRSQLAGDEFDIGDGCKGYEGKIHGAVTSAVECCLMYARQCAGIQPVQARFRSKHV